MRIFRLILIILSGGLIIISVFLGLQVYISIQKYSNSVSSVTITPLKKEFLIFPQSASHTSFYEPKPYTTEVNNYPWFSGNATYTINSDGLNERYEYSIEKPTNAYRILTQGDSFTFGHFVDTASNWSELLEDTLKQKYRCQTYTKFEVINLGVRGYDLDYAVERFKTRGKKYNPDIVIWFVNDHHFYAVRELLTTRENQISESMSPIDINRYIEAGDYFPALHIALEESKRMYSLNKLIEHENASLYEFARNYTGPLIIVANKVNPKFLALLDIFRNYRKGSTVIYKSIPDITKIQNATFPDGHPNTLGHEIYAKDIYDLLAKGTALCPVEN